MIKEALIKKLEGDSKVRAKLTEGYGGGNYMGVR